MEGSSPEETKNEKENVEEKLTNARAVLLNGIEAIKPTASALLEVTETMLLGGFENDYAELFRNC